MTYTDLSIATQTRLPTAHGEFMIVGFTPFVDRAEHVALVYGDVRGQDSVLTRIHSECLTGDVFASKRCDCGEQLHTAMDRIVAEGRGVILYLRQEGRGIGRGLVHACEEALFARHPLVWLETARSSRAAGFYRRLGWGGEADLGDGDVRLEKRRS